DLKPLQILAAREVQVDSGRKAVIIFFPARDLSAFRAIQKTLVEELEKKFGGSHVVLIAQRTILSKNFRRDRRFTGPRPRSRTLKHVQEAILEDMVYPTEIVGQRTRVTLDGKLHKVYLSSKDQQNVETKLDTFTAVYKSLTNKQVVFQFPL
ncbi:rps7, partial [Symbiodinium sp. KB8]